MYNPYCKVRLANKVLYFYALTRVVCIFRLVIHRFDKDIAYILTEITNECCLFI